MSRSDYRHLVGILAVGALVLVAAAACFPRTHTAPAQDREPLAALSSGGSCGVELWAKKTLTDAQAGQVNLTSQAASVALVNTWNGTPDTASRLPFELQVWKLTATMTGYAQESDSDVHIVLTDGGQTMIAEIPSPACDEPPVTSVKSRVYDAIAKARGAFEAAHPLSSACFDCLSQQVTITGVGFLDLLHNQHGVSTHGAELHPVLSFADGSQPSPPPPPAPPPPPGPVPPPPPPPVGKDDALDELPGCARWPGRVWFHHLKQNHCAREFFLTP